MIEDKLVEAEMLLEEARMQLNKGKSLKALRLTKRARSCIENVAVTYKQAKDAIARARNLIDEVRRTGGNTSEAEQLLDNADRALSQKDYRNVYFYASQSFHAALMLVLVPGRDITVKTAINSKEGKTAYEISIENNTDKPVRNLHIFPDLVKDPYVPVPEKVVTLKPGKEKKIVFDLKLKDSYEKREGDLVPGKDISVQTLLRPIHQENRIVYTIWIKNDKDEVLRNIRVIPNLPEILELYEKEKIIDELRPQETKGLVFELRVR
jgi:hypothetical protein